MRFGRIACWPRDTWIPEIVSVALSLAAWAVNMALLGAFNGQPVFEWHKATLNTLVSVFSTLSRVLLLFAVSSALGQWKYIAFAQQQRKLIEFQHFDQASRGAHGSLMLLWSTGLRSLAGLGALIMVVSLAIDPFTQSIMSFSTRQTSEMPSSISRALRYSKGTQLVDLEDRVGSIYDGIKGITSIPDFSMQLSILAGFSGQRSAVHTSVFFTCASNTCEWEPFESLGVCSKCNNVNSSLEVTSLYHSSYITLYDMTTRRQNPRRSFAGQIVQVRLPNGLFMDGWPARTADAAPEQVAMVSSGTTDPNATISFKDFDTLLYAMSFIKAPPDVDVTEDFPDVPLEATECALYYCVNEYSPSAHNGTLHEPVREVSREQTPGSWRAVNQSLAPNYHPTSLAQTINFPRTDLELVGSYNISQAAINGLGTYMSSLTQERFSPIANANLTDVTGFYSASPSGDRFQFAPDVMKPLYDAYTLDSTFSWLAHSMSSNMRVNADAGTMTFGQTGITAYLVHWPRIALPLLECVGACVFLAITIAKSRSLKVALWKSSSLAMLACGANVPAAFGAARSLSDMEVAAEKMAIPLMAFDGEELATLRKTNTSQSELLPSTKMDG
ncbi:hypothetical protein BC567DRAFT_15141 [Phyllosticta citribraziliensis]